jgi:hypothetical protein
LGLDSPVLARDDKVFDYELLFRDGVEAYFRSSDPAAASRSTLDSSILMGLDVFCDSTGAFENCTRELLLKDYLILLSSAQTVVEVLQPSRALCRRVGLLRREAFDKIPPQPPQKPLQAGAPGQEISAKSLDPQSINEKIEQRFVPMQRT